MDEGCLTIDFNGGRSLIVEENEEMGCMTVKKT
jgi:hypothetical protein